MISTRRTAIKEELLKSYAIRGSLDKLPNNESLDMQATLIDADLSTEAETKHVSTLFKIARGSYSHPALTELKKAWRSEEFLALFPRKMKVDRFIPRSAGDSQASAHAMEDMLDACCQIFPQFNRRERKDLK